MKDFGEAFKWCSKSAAQGHANAQYNLGIFCQYGLGVTKDLDEAEKWYRKATEQDIDNAKEALMRLEQQQLPD